MRKPRAKTDQWWSLVPKALSGATRSVLYGPFDDPVDAWCAALIATCSYDGPDLDMASEAYPVRGSEAEMLQLVGRWGHGSVDGRIWHLRRARCSPDRCPSWSRDRFWAYARDTYIPES